MSIRDVELAALWTVVGVSAALWLMFMLSGCAAAGSGRSGGNGSAGSGGNGMAGSGGNAGSGNAGSGGNAGNGGGPGLTIMPLDQVLTVNGGMTPPTLQFSAALDGQSVTANFSLDRGELGSFDANGLFTPGGLGGKATVFATYGMSNASTSLTINLVTTQNGDPNHAHPPVVGAGGYGGVGGDGPGGSVTPTQQGTLTGPATVDNNVRLVYPYDGTVWPRGLLPPLLQWQSGSHHFDSVMVKLHEKAYDYTGYFSTNNGTNFNNLVIPDEAWKELTYSNKAEEATVSVTFAEGSKAYGPYTMKWRIAQATLKGSIYYNSYGTYLLKNSGSDGLDFHNQQYGAGTLAIKPGANAPVKVAGYDTPNPSGDGTGCRVCHTVAANGKGMVTQGSTSDGLDYSKTYYLDLQNDTTGGKGTLLPTRNLMYPALYPDGSLLFSSSAGLDGGGYTTPGPSTMYALPAGGTVAVKGLPTGFDATLPVFSPDGKHLAFNFWSGTFTGGPSADQRSLTVLDFDQPSMTFSKPRTAFTPAGGDPASFSSFTPDSTGVIFAVQLSAPSGDWGATWNGGTGGPGDTAEIWYYNLAANKAVRLDQLNGVGLPDNGVGGTHPPGLDATLNYEPTVNPIASGGYAWVVFTSRRMYGNIATLDPWLSDPHDYDATSQIPDKKLWVAAVDLDNDEFASVVDRSHPAFYLPAQEIHAGNARGFWTPEPCRKDGVACDTGDECCGGYCATKNGQLVCTPDKPPCAAEFDKCASDADCCGAGNGIQCVNNICTQGGPIV